MSQDHTSPGEQSVFNDKSPQTQEPYETIVAENIDLSFKGLAEVTPRIFEYTELETLVLTGNRLTSLPPEIGQLTHLRQLVLTGNQLTSLPPEIGQLTSLQELKLDSNKLPGLPAEIRALANLQTLWLDKNQLAELPAEIIHLSSLRQLVLTGNKLTSLPPEIGQLTHLRQLVLTGNQLTSLPPEIGQLTSLQELKLDSNKLPGLPAEIRALANLQTLWLDKNQLAELPAEIIHLSSLRQLVLTGDKLTSLPPEIGQLTHLRQLVLTGNKLTSLPPEIGQLTHLRQLVLTGNQLTSLPPEIGQLTSLQELKLDSNKLPGLPAEIRALANLQTLWLDKNQLAELPAEIIHLSSLRQLTFNDNQLTSLPPEIGQLTSLQELKLDSNKLPGLPAEIRALANLQTLWLDKNQLAELPAEIIHLSSLRQLTFNDNQLTSLPPEIGQLTSLQQLYLNNNKLTSLPLEIAQLTSLQQLYLTGNKLTSLPLEIAQLTSLQQLHLTGNKLTSLPPEIAQLTSLQYLDLESSQLTSLPPEIGQLTSLQYLDLDSNQLTSLPPEIGQLTSLQQLVLDSNQLTSLPPEIGQLTSLQQLYLNNNQLTSLPPEIGQLTSLQQLVLDSNQLTSLPPEIGQLTSLQQLYLNNNQLTSLRPEIGQLTSLRDLVLSGNQVTSLPPEIGQLTSLQELDLNNNQLTALPVEIRNLPQLLALLVADNRLSTLPPELGGTSLFAIHVYGNPLPPEMLAASDEGTDTLLQFLALLHKEGQLIHEAKLVLVGEGEVGKSSLLAALRGEPWVENRDTTHGIQIKPVEVVHEGVQITLNGWDFGGQAIYRPTHQLFFTNPAIYLVVWKPREGPELGLVEHWISMIQHRAGAQVHIHIVATHGGPGQRYAHLNEAALRQRFGDVIVGFHHVDSKTGFGLDQLRAAIATTAVRLPHVSRWYPASWLKLREALSARRSSSLQYIEYETLAVDSGLSAISARSLAINSHSLGHWVYYSDDPSLADLVILRPDWLSVAIGFVLENESTIKSGGLLPHQRLAEIWDDPNRDVDHRYGHTLQQIFLRLMERFELTYRVPEIMPGEPLSLVAQLVPANPPVLSKLWKPNSLTEVERTQVLRIAERESGRVTIPEGLIFRLIVLFHRYSLGIEDVIASAHWQTGVMLRNRYGSLALITVDNTCLNISAQGRGSMPFLQQIVTEIRDYVEEFWKGLVTHVMVPCVAPCGLNEPGRGLFDIDKLVARRGRGRSDYPCPAPSCDHDADIEALLEGQPSRGRGEAVQLATVIQETVNEALDPQIQHILHEQAEGIASIIGRIDHLDDDMVAAFSRAEERLSVLLRNLGDEAASGPRLFTLSPLDRTALHPNLMTRRVRVNLWCEHSHLPLYLLDADRPDAGVYIIDVPKDWWIKVGPVIKTTSLILQTLLPVSLYSLSLSLPAHEMSAIKEELALGSEVSKAMAEAVQEIPTELSGRHLFEITDVNAQQAIQAEGGLLRALHAELNKIDPTFADLRRVRDHYGRFLWVHPRFVPIYQPPLPEIPQ